MVCVGIGIHLLAASSKKDLSTCHLHNKNLISEYIPASKLNLQCIGCMYADLGKSERVVELL